MTDVRWKELFSVIADLSDEELLLRRWAGLIPDVAASPTEDIALIFNTFGLEEAVGLAPQAIGLSEQQFAALQTFRNAANAFLDALAPGELRMLPYAKVWASPGWQRVMAAAKDFVDIRSAA